MNRSLVLAAPFLLVGCIDYTLDEGKDVVDPINTADPCIEVVPGSIMFEDITVTLDPSQTQLVQVSNNCEGDLEIYAVEPEDPSQPFTIGSLGSVFLPQDSVTEFTVEFDPQTSADYATRVLIDSNDPETPTAVVEITGRGIAPIIDVSPDDYDFGNPFIGCNQEQPYTVANVGNAPLTVDNFSFASASPDFDFNSNQAMNGALPYVISAGNAVEVFVDYMPLDEFADDAFLTVTSDDPFTSEVTVFAEGTGTKYGDNLDVFEQPIKAATDIIFTLDRSCSMEDDNILVVANFATFINTLVGLDADYHVAVVVEDDGCVLGSDTYIDNTFEASNAESTFETMADIYITAGSYGANTERGFSLAEAALSPGNIGSGGCNEGMYRDDAYLSLVHVSDEPEQSLNSWGDYVTLFQSLKANPDDMIINAVAGDYPSGCGSASAGTGYYEGTLATGGLFLSICATDWATHLEELAIESVAINDSFELTQLPVPQTIDVTVDGITVSSGWEYDVSSNSVVFDAYHIPVGGSTVEVLYDVMPDCEG